MLSLFSALAHGVPQLYTDINTNDLYGLIVVIMLALQPVHHYLYYKHKYNINYFKINTIYYIDYVLFTL